MLPATPTVLPVRATAALPLATGAAPVEDALAVSEVEAEPVLEGLPEVVLVDRVVEAEDDVESVVSLAAVPVEVELVVVVELTLSDEVSEPPDLVTSKVSDWARMPVFWGSVDSRLNLYLAPGVATKLVRLKLPSEVLTLSPTGMGVMLLWSTRTRSKVDGSVDTEVHLISMVLEKSSFSSFLGEVTMIAVVGALLSVGTVRSGTRPGRETVFTLGSGEHAGESEERLGEHFGVGLTDQILQYFRVATVSCEPDRVLKRRTGANVTNLARDSKASILAEGKTRTRREKLITINSPLRARGDKYCTTALIAQLGPPTPTRTKRPMTTLAPRLSLLFFAPSVITKAGFAFLSKPDVCDQAACSWYPPQKNEPFPPLYQHGCYSTLISLTSDLVFESRRFACP